MKLRTTLGILSAVAWVAAMLTVLLPIVSVAMPGALSVTPDQTSPGSGQAQLSIPPGYTVANKGFLPIDGVYLDVVGFYPNGTQAFSVKSGPVNLPPGAVTEMSVVATLPRFSPNSTGALNDITLQATATATLGGLIPVSADADLRVPVNATGAPG